MQPNTTFLTVLSMHGTRYLAKQYLPLPCHLSKDVCYSLSSRFNNSLLFVFLHSTIICVLFCFLFSFV